MPSERESSSVQESVHLQAKGADSASSGTGGSVRVDESRASKGVEVSSAPVESETPGDPLDISEDRLIEMYGSEEPDMSNDVINALRESDFSLDPDSEEEDEEEGDGEVGARNIVKVEKKVEVLADGLKRPALSDGVEAMQLRWRSLVSSLKPPLSNIMEHASVKEFSAQSVSITLSTAFEGIFTKQYEGFLTQQIRQQFGWQVKLSVVFEANADETATLAAEAARELMAREAAEREELMNHPLFQAVLKTFHLEPEKAHITCNSDRIIS